MCRGEKCRKIGTGQNLTPNRPAHGTVLPLEPGSSPVSVQSEAQAQPPYPLVLRLRKSLKKPPIREDADVSPPLCTFLLWYNSFATADYKVG